MRLNLRINESVKTIESRILAAFAMDLNLHIQAHLPAISIFFKTKIKEIILKDPASWYLSNSKLKADFGLDFDPVPAIAQAVADSTNITFTKIDRRLKGGLRITVQPLDYFNLLSLPESIVITEKGVQLPWLEWLLLYGNSVIVVNFGVLYKHGVGRSGLGIMVKGSRPFTVDPSFSGTKDDNWITRAIDYEVSSLEIGLMNILS